MTIDMSLIDDDRMSLHRPSSICPSSMTIDMSLIDDDRMSLIGGDRVRPSPVILATCNFISGAYIAIAPAGCPRKTISPPYLWD
ncbi:hypothetical protein IQ235_09445 [Oscillatoriales cyanobacterium LEGE 11467]|uniref:Uncharacterized protein n=1 Tax=Zarconia navalis LEGE 11467 TaxID=1828826 RepID=A0A928Z8T3_9CYAN|nr:hypothetical protein [Zarconia navalis]MBE9041003.1 hypothetical protein [Zarconia navalis LEGE 11467]